MASPFGRLRLIVNPRAGHRGVARALPELRAELERRELDHDVVVTSKAPGSATELARAALDEGVRFLVAVGGDGTISEVANGMLAIPTPDAAAAGALPSPIVADAVLGVAGAGSGSDFVRTFGLDRKPGIVAKHLAGDATMPVDVGLVRFTDAAGRPATRAFVNIAQVGYGGEVVRRARRLPRALGRVRYLLAAYGAIAGLERQVTDVEVAHTTAAVPLVDLVVANGQFFGGGMKVAPRALPDDGRFNVQVFTGQRSQVFLLTQRLYRGEHLPHPEIAEYQSPMARVAPAVPLAVEADGDYLGTTPAAFTLAPQALRLKI